jgi:uncharacterized RDD family membrane protein YckC
MRAELPDRTAEWIGDTLGIAIEGPGSIASWPRRIAALLVDMLLLGFRIVPWAPAAPFTPTAGLSGPWRAGAFAGIWVLNLVVLPGRTLGKWLCCLRIRDLDEDRRPAVLAALKRSVGMIAPFAMLVTMDDDRRHLADRWGRTMVIDTRAWWRPSDWR